MKIELGKTYRTRGGGKARVVCVDYKDTQPVIALHKGDGNTEATRFHCENGRWLLGEENRLDLISEWTDKPAYDPETFPKWKWAAVDGDGTAYVYTEKPDVFSVVWHVNGGNSCKISTPKDYNGDWINSLVKLP